MKVCQTGTLAFFRLWQWWWWLWHGDDANDRSDISQQPNWWKLWRGKFDLPPSNTPFISYDDDDGDDDDFSINNAGDDDKDEPEDDVNDG